MIQIFAQLLVVTAVHSGGPAGGLSTTARCLPIDSTNPAYQVLCARFDQDQGGCETQRHICYWQR